MADQRCPMCGKPNPPQNEVCQYCQARLKPLILPSAFDDSQPLVPEENEDLFPTTEDTLPDWLGDFREEDQPAAEEQEQAAGEESAEIWSAEEEQRLSSAFIIPSEDEEGQQSEEDWLARLNVEQGAQAEEPSPEEETEVESQATGSFPDQEPPDWLSEFPTSSLGLEDQSPASPPGESLDAETPDVEERPHWLGLIRAQQEKEQEQATSLQEGEQEQGRDESFDGGPDWLSDIHVDVGDEKLSLDIRDLPDWLVESGALEVESQPESDQPMPGWMDEDESLVESPAPEPDVEMPIEARPDLPDWLSNIHQKDAGGSGLPEPVDSEEDELISVEANALPDWLTRLDSPAGEQPPDHDVPTRILEEEAEELPTAGTPEAELAPEQDLSVVPDWLKEIADQDGKAEEAGPGVTEQEPDMAAAQLPSWLQSIRPVESAAPSAPALEEREKLVEKVGPLAGLAGVLPAEPEYAHLSKPKSSLVKLQVSDNQQAHINLLENLLAEEGQAKPLAAGPVITSQYFLRLLIGLVILVSVIAPLWLNRQYLPLTRPGGVSQEVYDFQRSLSGLSSGAPVLVAFDYEPSYSGELDAIAAAVFSDMAGHNAQLVAISTNPTGPVLAERFMASWFNDLVPGYINLGYIPGGATGLLAFAQSPREVNPFDLRGVKVWESGTLAPVENLSDFAMVVVITENPDTARSWIEQVQPFLKATGKPMLMVLSAQAEPMVRPYYDSVPRQVNGMVSGLAGAAAYESITGTGGAARLYWDAFGVGLIIAAALILVGGLANLVLALLAKPDQSKGKGVL